MDTLFQALLTFSLTIVAGAWITSMWQERSARQQRYFESSKERYEKIDKTVKDITRHFGIRIYRTQRAVLFYPDMKMVKSCLEDLNKFVVEYNEKLMEFELSIRSYFRMSYLSDIEDIQFKFYSITREVNRGVQIGNLDRAGVLSKLGDLRRTCFVMIRGMIDEAKDLDREMHFGVVLRYDETQIEKWTTLDLLKSIFFDRRQVHSIVRPPSYFGSPVGADEARFGVN